MILTVCLIICIVGDQVQAKETVHVVRKAVGDMEQLEAIEISEETAEQWKKEEVYQYSSGTITQTVSEFFEYGSDY